MKNFDFYYGNESEQFSFYRLPRELFTNKYYSKLSPLAKILYGLLIDRMSLSRKNGWIDDNNRVYIIFKVEEVKEYLDCGRTKAIELFKELIEYNLIKKEKQGMGKPALIYVFNIYKEAKADEEIQGEETFESEDTDNLTRDFIPNNNNNPPMSADARQPQKSEICTSEVQNTDFGGTEYGLLEVRNADFRGTKYGLLEVQNPYSNYNNSSYKYINNTDVNYNKYSYSCYSYYKPDFKQIQDYIQNNNYDYDAEYFYNYYKSRNWRIGNAPIADFNALKAIMDNWQYIENHDRNLKSEVPGLSANIQRPKGIFNNYDQRTYSEDEINAILKRKEAGRKKL